MYNLFQTFNPETWFRFMTVLSKRTALVYVHPDLLAVTWQDLKPYLGVSTLPIFIIYFGGVHSINIILT